MRAVDRAHVWRLAGGAERDEQWHQVLDGGMRMPRMRCQFVPGEQGREVAAPERVMHPRAELRRPRRQWRLAMLPVEVAEVVHKAARADHQHAFIAQPGQRLPDGVVLRGTAVRHHRQRHHRNVGVRIHPPQRHPHAVVQAMARSHLRRQPGVAEPGGDVLGQAGQSRRRVLQLVQRLGKAAEIVHGVRLRMAAQHRPVGHEMRGSNHDRAGSRQGIAESVQEAAGRGGLDRQHRRTVGKEQGGKAGRSIHASKMTP